MKSLCEELRNVSECSLGARWVILRSGWKLYGCNKLPVSHHFLVLSLGGGFRGMRNSALMGCMSHKAVEKYRNRTQTLDRM